MAKTRVQKEADLAELTEKVKSAKSIVLSDYRGTSVKDMDKLRRTLEKEHIFTKVYKVTLIQKALEAAGIEAGTLDYKTPVIVMASDEDETSPARVVKGLSKDIKTVSILSGVLEQRIVAKAQVEVLASLPSKDELRAKLVGTINSPVVGFVNVLAGNLRGLVNVLNAVASK